MQKLLWIYFKGVFSLYTIESRIKSDMCWSTWMHWATRELFNSFWWMTIAHSMGRGSSWHNWLNVWTECCLACQSPWYEVHRKCLEPSAPQVQSAYVSQWHELRDGALLTWGVTCPSATGHCDPWGTAYGRGCHCSLWVAHPQLSNKSIWFCYFVIFLHCSLPFLHKLTA